MTVPNLSFTLMKSTRVPKSVCDSADFEGLAAFVLESERVAGPVELSVEITGHAQIHELNRRFRGVDRTTDVISFRSDADPTRLPSRQSLTALVRDLKRRGFLGDLAINVEQAALQAKKLGQPLPREMRLLLIHGILHLLEYTDYD